MKKLPALLLPVLGILFISSCGEDEICGAKSDWDADVQDQLIYNNYDAISNTRFLIYEDLTTPEDICPDEHVRVVFNVYAEEFVLPPADLVVKGKAYWGLYEDEVSLVFDSLQGKFFGELPSVGLKQAFGEDPGWIGLQIHVNMESAGTLEQDTAAVQFGFTDMHIDFEYYKFLL